MANSYALLTSLNGLAAGLFLMSSFGLAATRQMQGCQRFYITQSICLVVSALLLGLGLRAPDLLAVAALDSVMRPIVIRGCFDAWCRKRFSEGGKSIKY